MANQQNRTGKGRQQDQQKPSEKHVQVTQSMSYSGLLPLANEVEKYERVLPGAADRIFSLTERQQEHRFHQERVDRDIAQKASEANVEVAKSNARVQDASIKEVKRGQIFAFIVSLGYLGVVLTLGVIGQPILSGILGVSGIGGVILAFSKFRNK